MKECDKCGLDPAHSAEECAKQQEVNRANLSQEYRCPWCGTACFYSNGDHKEGCPRQKKDKTTVTHDGDTTIYKTECGYCGAVSEQKSTKANKWGHGGGFSVGGAEHKFGCPKHIRVMNRAS